MNYKDYNDYELIYMVREQDENSYGVLFQKYIPVIRRLAAEYYRSFGSYGYDLDDFIQEGYLAFQKALRSFDEEKEILFYTFATVCIRRKLCSFCRKISSDKKNISNEFFVDYEEYPVIDVHNDTEGYFSYESFWNSIWDIVYDCSFEYICVFELRLNHFHYSEIEKLLGISIRRAQVIMKRIQIKLRKEVNFFT